jgi:hypothetical protein
LLSGPNTRSTQLFINYGDNAKLDSLGFAPFAKVADAGLTVARRVFNPTPNDTGGVDQSSYEAKGNAWIRQKKYPGVNFILGASVTAIHQA